MEIVMARSMDTPINWRVVWPLLLTPVAGCAGYVLIIMFSLVMYHRLPTIGGDENRLVFFAIAFGFAATIGGVFAAPVTLAVLPIVRRRRPGQDKTSFFTLAFCGLISGFLSPVVITFLYAINTGFIKQNLEASLLLFGSVGSVSGLIMAVVWFFLTPPPKTPPPTGPIVGDSVDPRIDTDAQP
jgi:hypothetical protein